MRRFRIALASVALAVGTTAGGFALAAPATAQPVTQQGLVNVNVSNVGVQVPIALAANVCDVNVAVLVSELQDGSAPCAASSTSNGQITFDDSNGPIRQRGLVNVNLSNVAVQIPIGVAANVCDVNVAVLVNQFLDTASQCQAGVDVTSIAG
jgi:hypothetical protein